MTEVRWTSRARLADCTPNPAPSHLVFLAYIDPGAGSMVIQAVLAAALAIPFFFRTNVRSAVERLRSLRRSRATRDDGQTTTD